MVRTFGLFLWLLQSVANAELVVTDAKTRVSNLQTLFTNTELLVSVDTITSTGLLSEEEKPYKLFVDDELHSSGTVSVENESIPLVLKSHGTHNIRLEVNETTEELKIQSYPSGVLVVPFVVLLLSLLMDDKLVMAYYAGTAVAAIFVAGNMFVGSANVFTVYLVQALIANVHVMLFILFFSGIMGVIQRSGGLTGLTNLFMRYFPSRWSLQLGIVSFGSLLCWDDVSTVLITGDTIRDAANIRNISREKLAFLLDVTSLSNILPVSAMTGILLSVLNAELDRLGRNDVSAVTIMLQSLRFTYYPVFMSVLVVLLILTQREFGPMLVAERNALVRKVQKSAEIKESSKQPDGQPAIWWLGALPLTILAVSAYLSLVGSGDSDDGEAERGFYEKLAHASLLQALLEAVSLTITVSLLIGALTFVLDDGRITFGPWYIVRKLLGRGSEESTVRSVVNLNDYIRTLLGTAGRMFPTLINLVFAWSTALAFSDAGVGNLIARWINGGKAEYLSTIGFLVATLFSLLTGSNILAVSTLVPLILESALHRSNDAAFAAVGAIVSGAMAGRQLSPISQTLILSASSGACTVWGHLYSQVPYVLVVCGFTVLLALMPGWPTAVSYLAGLSGISAFALLICKPILSDDGKYDIITELFVRDENELLTLKQETADFFRNGKREFENQSSDNAAETTSPLDRFTSDSCSEDQGMEIAPEDYC